MNILELCGRTGRLKLDEGSCGRSGEREDGAPESKVKETFFFFFAYLSVKLMCEKRPISPPLSVFLLFLNSLVPFRMNVSAVCLSLYFFVLLLAVE